VPVHRAVSAVIAASLILVACGSDDPEASSAGTASGSAASAAASGSAAPENSTPPPSEDGEEDAGDAPSDTSAGSADTAASGSADSSATGDTGSDGSAPAGSGDAEESAGDPGGTSAEKPEVEVPDAIPDELDITTLQAGDGPEAVAGDTLIVDYVGVRTEDGLEFDNSYDRDQPLAITLGTGGVIQGWDEGLVGAQAGERRQLDIPSDLAYGAEARGEVIRENEALTFVVDVRSVISTDPTEAPATDLAELDLEVPQDVVEVTTVDLVEGDGDELQMGDTAVFHFVLFRADNGAALDSTWSTQPIQLPLEETTFQGLLEGLPGMNVGGRRAIVVPPDQGFGPEGNPQLGLPADTDIVIVADLLARY
jgi:FKBP-type peptidyl-prolyl cis-trans isomerase